MGKSIISMAIFNSYVKFPEGKWSPILVPSFYFLPTKGVQYPDAPLDVGLTNITGRTSKSLLKQWWNTFYLHFHFRITLFFCSSRKTKWIISQSQQPLRQAQRLPVGSSTLSQGHPRWNGKYHNPPSSEVYYILRLGYHFFKMGNHILRWVIYWAIIFIIFYDGKPYFFSGQTPLRHSQMMPNGSSRDLAVLLGIPCSRTKVLSGTYEILSKLPNVFYMFLQ